SPCEARAGRGLERGGTFHRIGAANWNPLSLTLSPLLCRGERESTSGMVVLRGAQRWRYGSVSVENAKEGVRWNKHITPKLHCSKAAIALPTFRLCKSAQRT